MCETGEPLHPRVNGHLFDILHQKADVSPVAEHFNSGVHPESDMKVMVVELSTTREPCLRKVKEGK